MTFVHRGTTTLLESCEQKHPPANHAPWLQIVPERIGQPIVLMPNREAMFKAMHEPLCTCIWLRCGHGSSLFESFEI